MLGHFLCGHTMAASFNLPLNKLGALVRRVRWSPWRSARRSCRSPTQFGNSSRNMVPRSTLFPQRANPLPPPLIFDAAALAAILGEARPTSSKSSPPTANALSTQDTTSEQKTGGWARVPHGAKMRATDNHEVSGLLKARQSPPLRFFAERRCVTSQETERSDCESS